MRNLALAVLAAALVAAPSAVSADEFTLDLTKVDPNTPQGQDRIRRWKENLADQYCGPVNMPQPIEMLTSRIRCHAVVLEDVQLQIDAAYARQDKELRYVKIVSSNR